MRERISAGAGGVHKDGAYHRWGRGAALRRWWRATGSGWRSGYLRQWMPISVTGCFTTQGCPFPLNIGLQAILGIATCVCKFLDQALFIVARLTVLPCANFHPHSHRKNLACRGMGHTGLATGKAAMGGGEDGTCIKEHLTYI